MNIYFVEMPKDTSEKEKLNSLLNGLEAFYKVETIDVIGIRTSDLKLDEMLNEIAINVKRDGVSATTRGKNVCEECGASFTPKAKNSKFCSRHCAQKVYQRRNKEKRAGDGIISGKLNVPMTDA